MNETYNFIRDLMFGRKPLHRENPTAGQSEWYYMTPKNPNDLDNSEFDFVDVPTQNTPNPLLEKSFTNSVQTPLPATSIAAPTTTSVPQPLPVGNCLVKNSDIGNISSTDTLNDDINRLVTTLANLPSAVNKQLPLQQTAFDYHSQLTELADKFLPQHSNSPYQYAYNLGEKTANWHQEAKKIAKYNISDENKHQYMSCLAGTQGTDMALIGLGAGIVKEGFDLKNKLSDPDQIQRYGGKAGVIKDSFKDMKNNLKGLGYGYFYDTPDCFRLLRHKL